MIRFLTAGESHGKSLVTIIDGFPSNLPISLDYINFHLKRRQQGYGRSTRMKIESDAANILSGIRFGKTIGSPISILIENKDWVNWIEEMDLEKKSKETPRVTIPRPGHADLVGSTKYNFNDIRNSIERSSARETAARVAAGTVARKFLEHFGISIGSYVESIGDVYSSKKFFNSLLANKKTAIESGWSISLKADKSILRLLDKSQGENIVKKLKSIKKNGDTVGGTFITIATGIPVGLGSFMQYDQRLDADIAFYFMSINAVKGIEIGSGFSSAEKTGSQVHDEIIFNKEGFSRSSNNAGGIEGGISNGSPIIVRSAMKPISTLAKPLNTLDLGTMKKVSARYERSDITAVPACAVISESMLAWVLAKHFLVKFGGDSIQETKDNFDNYNNKSIKRIRTNFRK